MDEAENPLEGKRIVLTRAPEQAESLSNALCRMGAEVLHMPTVGFGPPGDWSGLDQALKRLARFDWVLFTSANAVRFVAERGREIAAGAELFCAPKPRVAVVGAATANAAEEEGMRVDFVAKEQSGEGLARELREAIGSCGEVLLPRSDRADDRLPGALHAAGARVTEVIAYRTVAPPLDDAMVHKIRCGEADAIVFASPSAFHNLASAMNPGELARLSARVHLAAIGPTTARALREAGAKVEIEANEPSAAGIADALAKYYQRQKAEARQA